jgi:4-hydroxy-3-methylbut-2-en-1-yl diphosphate synthase IspG/GcpE
MNHIKLEDGLAWCQQPIPENEFHFKDLEQVIINNFHGERVACPYCIRKVINDLLSISPKVAQEVNHDPT